MRCARFLNLKNQDGSAVTGFVLVAPLVVIMFMVVIQVGSVLADRATLMMAAQSGVRVASTLDGTASQGRTQAMTILQGRHMAARSSVVFRDERRGAMHYVVCIAVTRRHVTWLNRDVTFTVTARAIDEGAL